jgi:hypothetical protein
MTVKNAMIASLTSAKLQDGHRKQMDRLVGTASLVFSGAEVTDCLSAETKVSVTDSMLSTEFILWS